MREIKFRAWDTERQEMLPVTSMNWPEWWVSCEPILEGIVHPLDYGERNSFKNDETDRHLLMQYTGLKDQNGVDIYEGDIITDGDWQNANLYVKYDTERGCWKFENDYTQEELFAYEVHVNAFEIIGNVFEHPHLLEGESK